MTTDYKQTTGYKHFRTRSILLFAFLLSSTLTFSQLWTNPITGTNPNTANPYTTGQSFDPNITVSGIGRGMGISGTNANDRYNANSWNTPSIDLTAYFEFTLTPNTGYQINFINFSFASQRSNTGPQNFVIRSSASNYLTDIHTYTSTIIATPFTTTISLANPTYQNITTPITFRIYAWGATDPGGTYSINDFVFNGTVVSTCVNPELPSGS